MRFASSCLSCILLLPQLCVQAAEVFRPQIDKLIAAKVRLETLDVLLLTHERGLCEFVWRDGLQPNFYVFFQRDRPVNTMTASTSAWKMT